MMRKPLVTVVIPTLARPEFLQQALESVHNQTYSPIEVVVVSDPSDSVAEVVERMESNMSTDITHLTNQEPAGLPAARNQGVDAASGDYIAFLDDDDVWYSNKIERQIRAVEAGSETLAGVYCGRHTFTKDWDYRHTEVPKKDGNLYNDLLARNIIGSPSKVLVGTDAFSTVNGFDPSVKYHEDWEFYLRFSKTYDWSCISAPLMARIAHPDAMSRDADAKKDARRRIISEYEEELCKRNLLNEALYNHYVRAGIDYCMLGDSDKGRVMFRQALKNHKSMKTMLLYSSAHFGSFGFRALAYLNRWAASAKQLGRTPKLPLDESNRVNRS